MSVEAPRIDVSSAHAAKVFVRAWQGIEEPSMGEEIVDAVVATTVGGRTMVQLERITPTHWDSSIAYRPGMGWKGDIDAALHDIYLPLDPTQERGIRASESENKGRWVPINEVGKIVEAS